MLLNHRQELLTTLRQKLGIVLHDSKALIAAEGRWIFSQKLPQEFGHLSVSKTSSRVPFSQFDSQ
jgi:hypothetical protein